MITQVVFLPNKASNHKLVCGDYFQQKINVKVPKNTFPLNRNGPPVTCY